MARVWVKMRYDNDMQMEIPHSLNIVTAMMGFRALGAVLLPYHTIDEIYDDVSGDFCQVWRDAVCTRLSRGHGTVFGT